MSTQELVWNRRRRMLPCSNQNIKNPAALPFLACRAHEALPCSDTNRYQRPMTSPVPGTEGKDKGSRMMSSSNEAQGDRKAAASRNIAPGV